VYHGGDNPPPSLDPAVFESIIRQAKPLGLSGVKLTGGEPLLHPQIKEILGIIRENNLSLSIETNGILCSPEMAEKIRSSGKNPFVSVSLDGADARTHEWMRGVSGCFEPALQGIRNLVEAGIRPQIIMTLMRHNRGQMEAVVRLAESLGAGSVKFNILQPTARGERMHQAGECLSIDELVSLGQWVVNELSRSTRLRIFYDHPLAFQPLSRIFAQDGGGCAVCGILGIIGVLPDGSYAMCGIGETVPELVFGHAEKESLKDVWENSPVLVKLREGLPGRLEGVCGDCVMKARCLGSCIAQNYYRTRNLWAPFWYCEEAMDAGLFPVTRLAYAGR
jgi:SynChlorMet cassette radical SAM/SPASM protein ScmF